MILNVLAERLKRRSKHGLKGQPFFAQIGSYPAVADWSGSREVNAPAHFGARAAASAFRSRSWQRRASARTSGQAVFQYETGRHG